MNTRLRRLLLAAFAGLTLLIVAPVITAGSPAAVADPVCPDGTNWDDHLQICR